MKFMCIFLVSLTNKTQQPSVLENIRKMKKKKKKNGVWNLEDAPYKKQLLIEEPLDLLEVVKALDL